MYNGYIAICSVAFGASFL